MKTFDQWRLAGTDKDVVLASRERICEIFPQAEVILFGSRARCDAGPESDFDLLVLLPSPVSWEQKKTLNAILFDLELEKECTISSLIYDKNTWHQPLYRVMPIHQRIEEEGVLV